MKELVAKNKGTEQIEAHMLSLPQAHCPVQHFFGPGTYVRQVILPKGIIAIGHKQKYDQLNVMLSGKVAMIEDGKVKELTAPKVFVGPPGRKIGFVIETCVWLNIYATDEKDIDKLEEMFLEKSETFEMYDKEFETEDKETHEEDRQDFLSLLNDYGFDEETVRLQSEDKKDQIPLPDPWTSFISVRESNIEGKGIFISIPVYKDDVIGPARLDNMRTPIRRFTNHSKTPNCKFVKFQNGDIFIVALKNIAGCKGGSKGEELTVDYRQALSLSGIGELKCQE